MSILVVGATGFLGTEICRRLADKGTPPRALVRETSDPARVEALRRELGAEIIVGDLRDRESLDSACAGVDVVFSTATSIIREGEISAVDGEGQLNLVDAARGAGVTRFLYVSFEELGTGAPLEHAKRAVEERLRASGIRYTILRAGLFHETWLTPATGFDAANGTVNVYGSGEAELSWISLSDVATAAVNSLEEPETENAIVPIAGERLSYTDVVAAFEDVTGRSMAVQHVPAEALAAQRDASSDEREQSFAGLMLGVAAGSPPGDGVTWLRRLGVEHPHTVRDVAALVK
ncbi:MAG: SDR family oxidoreductase [Actinomycetota bacterium]|nr:SDR family oxidoreductase [Actinomycetota bacterium]MDQ2981661.1 SDR family oxidoreductase [Actinomycetota bacterium]